MLRKNAEWDERVPEIGPGLCRPGETFSLLRRQRIGGRTSYSYCCVGPDGYRNMTEELHALGPTRTLGYWVPLGGGVTSLVLGFLGLGLLSPRRKNKTGRRDRHASAR